MANRDTGAAWNYHDGTKHSYWSVRRGGHYLDWAVQPLPYKVYRDLEPIPLPRDLSPSAVPAWPRPRWVRSRSRQRPARRQ